MLNLTKVSSGYGDIAVLRGVSLAVESAGFVAIVGANNAGKSTLINTISGVVRNDTGTINFDGIDVTRESVDERVRRGIIQVPEGRQLFPFMTVLENLLLGAYSKRRNRAECFGAISEVFALFPRLEERRMQKAGSLSGGEQQMLAVGRALVGNPALLMLDEPSLGLAPLIVDEIFRTLQGLNAGGMAVLVVEQNLHVALNYSSYAYVLSHGRIVAAGTPTELRSSANIREVYLGM